VRCGTGWLFLQPVYSQQLLELVSKSLYQLYFNFQFQALEPLFNMGTVAVEFGKISDDIRSGKAPAFWQSPLGAMRARENRAGLRESRPACTPK